MIDIKILIANINEEIDREIKMLTESILSPLTHEDYLKQVGSVHALQKIRNIIAIEVTSLLKKSQ